MDWKNQARLGLRFVVILALASGLIYGILHLAMPPVEWITALGSSAFLGLLGIPARTIGDEIAFSGGKARIVELCTGSLELALLLGAILATEDRTWRQRILGIVFALVSLYIINIVRVGITLASAVWYGWNFAELIHTALFKLFLVFAILGLYAIWYLWLSNKIE